MQFIRPDGGKRFLSGGRIYGCFCLLPGTKPAPILICEGFATGATLVEQTGSTCVVAFNAGNLLPVAKAVRAQHPKADIIVCGDNDAWTEGNPGATKARAAALEIGAQLLLPDFTGLDLSEKPTDFNDLARLRNASARRAA
nr:toprim domain-containing protein [Thiorhodovibrio winogradskyi]